jgi:hypothetical protein
VKDGDHILLTRQAEFHLPYATGVVIGFESGAPTRVVLRMENGDMLVVPEQAVAIVEPSEAQAPSGRMPPRR